MATIQASDSAIQLCILLVEQYYGEYPSRVFKHLLKSSTLGSTSRELCISTGLPAKRVRTGLAVLVQRGLVYFESDNTKRPPRCTYWPKLEAALDMVRIDKIVLAVLEDYGCTAAALVNILATYGVLKLKSLANIFHKYKRSWLPCPKGNGGSWLKEPESIDTFDEAFIELLQTDVVELCNASTFLNPVDVVKAARKEIIQTVFEGNKPRGPKAEDREAKCLDEKLSKIRLQPQQLRSMFIRRFESTKIQEMEQNSKTTAVRCVDINPRVNVRLNYDKCAVLLRNKALVQYATSVFGNPTGSVYALVLKLLTRHIDRCRPHPIFSRLSEQDNPTDTPPYVTTLDILDGLNNEIELSNGIGKVPGGCFSRKAAERLRPNPPKERHPYVDPSKDDEDDWEDDDDDDDDDDDYENEDCTDGIFVNDTGNFGNIDGRITSSKSGVSDGLPMVKQEVGEFDALAQLFSTQQHSKPDTKSTTDTRLKPLRRHLLLLANSSQRFLRHEDAAEGGRWAVDFKPLVASLQLTVMNQYLEERFSEQGLRTVEALREFGKLDEKTLLSITNTRKADVATALYSMHWPVMLSRVQEVPKDAKAMHLWFWEEKWAQRQLVEQCYVALKKCHEVLEARRYDITIIARTVERSDIRHRADELVKASEMELYWEYQRQSRRIAMEIEKAESIVSIFQHF